jgi:hypothetical protein
MRHDSIRSVHDMSIQTCSGAILRIPSPHRLCATALFVVHRETFDSSLGNVTLGLLLRFVTRELQCANDTYRLHRGDPGSPAARR